MPVPGYGGPPPPGGMGAPPSMVPGVPPSMGNMGKTAISLSNYVFACMFSWRDSVRGVTKL
jgi:hypothetical protein